MSPPHEPIAHQTNVQRRYSSPCSRLRVPTHSRHPCASRTAIITPESRSRSPAPSSPRSGTCSHPSRCAGTPWSAVPFSSRIQWPASRTMSSLPFGSCGRQCRPVLSCEPEPFTVPSFCATWKSIVHGRSAAVICPRAASRRSVCSHRNPPAACDPPARCSPA